MNKTAEFVDFFLSKGLLVIAVTEAWLTTSCAKWLLDHIDVRPSMLTIYSDNTELFINLSDQNPTETSDRIKSCLQDIKEWMSISKLKLNPEKTELVAFWIQWSKRQIEFTFSY